MISITVPHIDLFATLAGGIKQVLSLFLSKNISFSVEKCTGHTRNDMCHTRNDDVYVISNINYKLRRKIFILLFKH